MLIFACLALCLDDVYADHKTKAEAGGSVSPDNPDQYDTFIVYDSPKTKKLLKIYNVKTRFVDDILQASITMVSNAKKPVNIVYKFMWFDKSDFEVRANTVPWIPIMFQPGEEKTIQGVAPNSAARSFKIKISINK